MINDIKEHRNNKQSIKRRKFKNNLKVKKTNNKKQGQRFRNNNRKNSNRIIRSKQKVSWKYKGNQQTEKSDKQGHRYQQSTEYSRCEYQ